MPRLFSYGSLQQASVQLATFGRLLPGKRDGLAGFAIAMLQRGGKQLANAVRSARPWQQVDGTLFEITEAELLAADAYERADSYARIPVTLASGTDAWMYVEASSATLAALAGKR